MGILYLFVFTVIPSMFSLRFILFVFVPSCRYLSSNNIQTITADVFCPLQRLLYLYLTSCFCCDYLLQKKKKKTVFIFSQHLLEKSFQRTPLIMQKASEMRKDHWVISFDRWRFSTQFKNVFFYREEYIYILSIQTRVFYCKIDH